MATSPTSQPLLLGLPGAAQPTSYGPGALLIAARVLVLCAAIAMLLPALYHGWKPDPSLLAAEQNALLVALALFFRMLARPDVQYGALGILIVAAVVGMLERGYAACRLTRQSYLQGRPQRMYARIRTLSPYSGTHHVTAASGDGSELFHAAFKVLGGQPAALGTLQPWIGWTLGAGPGHPVELGAVIGGGTERQRGAALAALGPVLMGQDAELMLDTPPDPLEQAVRSEAGQLLVTADFLLRQPPEYPIRFPGEASVDLLGGLCAVVRPSSSAVRYVELQIIAQPRHEWSMQTSGWRTRALRRLLKMKSRLETSLSPDAQALEVKLQGPAYSTLVRVVVVATEVQAGRAAVARVETTLGQYAARSGNRLQEWRRAGGLRSSVPALMQPMVAPAVVLPLLPARDQRQPIEHQTRLAHMSLRSRLMAWGRTAFPAVRQSLNYATMYGLSGSILVWGVSAFGWRSGALLGLIPLVCLYAWAVARLRHSGRAAELRIERVLNRAPRILLPAPILTLIPHWRSPAILSAAELGGLWHLPTAALGQLVRWLPNRQLLAPPHAFAEGDPERIRIGFAHTGSGELVPVGPTLQDLREVCHLTAGMGTGKSRLLANMCRDMLPFGLMLIDGKGDDAGNLTATVRGLIPFKDEGRVALLDLLDADWPIAINPLAGVDLSQVGAADLAFAIVESIIARLDPENWASAPGMKQYLSMATILVLHGEPRATMAHVKQALLDEAYRTGLLERCLNKEVRDFWEITYQQTGEQQRSSMLALLRRFDELLVPELTRFVLNQAQPAFSFPQAIAERLIVLAPIPHTTLGRLSASVSMLLYQAFLRAAKERPGTAQTRHNYPLVVDEFQILVKSASPADVEDALTQIRSFAIPTVYANQSMSQLGGDIVPLMLINAQSRIILQTRDPDAALYAGQYASSGLSAADISGQDPFAHQYVTLRCKGQPTGVFSMVPAQWPAPLAVEVPVYQGEDWQGLLPPDSQPGDDMLLELIYRPGPNLQAMAEAMAVWPEEVWRHALERWDQLRRYHRRHILQHPGCIPDRDARVRWLSRLLIARPRLFAAAEYARIRRAIDPAGKDRLSAIDRTIHQSKGAQS